MKKILFAALTIMLISSCSKKDETSSVVYTKVSISKMTILDYPTTKPNGDDWDIIALSAYKYPDVYFKITESGTSNSLYSSSTVQDLKKADLPYYWSNSSGAPFYVLNNLNQIIDVDLYDLDAASSDYMGTATVNFTNYTTGSNKYPTTVTASNGSVSVKLDLIWLQ